MESYRAINKELSLKNQELRQLISTLVREKHALAQKVLSLEQINYKLKKSINTILEATQSYSLVLQSVCSDHQNIVKRSHDKRSRSTINCSYKKRSLPLRDCTNLPRRTDSQRNSSTIVDDILLHEKTRDKKSFNDSDIQNSSADISANGRYISDRKKRKTIFSKPNDVKEESYSEDCYDVENTPSSPTVSIRESTTEEVEDQEGYSIQQNEEDNNIYELYPIYEETNLQSTYYRTITEESSITNTVLQECSERTLCHPAYSDKKNVSRNSSRTLYDTGAIQATQTEDDNIMKDFSISKLDEKSSTPHKMFNTTCDSKYPKVIVRKLSHIELSDNAVVTGNTFELGESSKLNSEQITEVPKQRKTSKKKTPSKTPSETKTSAKNSNAVELGEPNRLRPRRKAAPTSLAEPDLHSKLRS